MERGKWVQEKTRGCQEDELTPPAWGCCRCRETKPAKDEDGNRAALTPPGNLQSQETKKKRRRPNGTKTIKPVYERSALLNEADPDADDLAHTTLNHWAHTAQEKKPMRRGTGHELKPRKVRTKWQ